MKTVLDFPDKRVLAEEAAEWLIRLDSDTPPSRHELRALGEWLHRSPAHRDEIEKLAGLWNRMNLLTEIAVPLRKAGLQYARNRSHSVGSAGHQSRLRRVLAAAAVLGAFALGIGYFLNGPVPRSLTAANGLYATAVGQQTTTTLPDGSQVVLNTDSQMQVDYGDEYRRVHLLRGEALFVVAKDGARSFRVYAGNGRIEALGTAFGVYLKGTEVEVTVTEGRVALASIEPPHQGVTHSRVPAGNRKYGGGSNESIADEWAESLGTLSAGQVAMIRSPDEGMAASDLSLLTLLKQLSPEELAGRTDWQDGILTFSGDPLEKVVGELSRYTNLSIEIPDPAVRATPIGGRFQIGETEAMLAALESNFHLRVTRLGHNRVVLTASDE
ncbi:MAG: DUF4880 domain-containing protein [Gammaproteobacteria bacterium]|nr:MAG: DUF4880 domain-containing protein [Gammaproteobacteria bacterium]